MPAPARQPGVDVSGLQVAPGELGHDAIEGEAAAGTEFDVVVFAYEFSRSQAFHFVALTKAGGAGTFNSMFNSVRRLTTAEAAAIKPRRIDVVTVGRGDTMASLARRMAYSNYQAERFQVLNRLTASSRLTPGQRLLPKHQRARRIPARWRGA